MLKKIFIVLPLMVLLLPSVYADTISDYQCLNYSGNRNAFTLQKLGLGVSTSGSDSNFITFCQDANPDRWCYASDNKIDTAAGKADYATLLSALTTGRKIGFYCEPGGYAKNIHIQ